MIRSVIAMPILVLATSLSTQLHAEEVCDCAIKKGNCSASLSVTPTSQPNGIFGARIKVMADTVSCARVDYYIEHTPNVTILRHGGSVEESVTGALKPMTTSMFSVDSCRICEVRTKQSPTGDESLAESLFDDAIMSNADFDPSATGERINHLESQDGSLNTETIRTVIDTVQQSQQIQQSQNQYRKVDLQGRTGGGYEYSNTDVAPLPQAK